MLFYKHFIRGLLLRTVHLLREVALFAPSSLVWRKKFHYTREPRVIDITWQKVYTTGVIVVPIDNIYGRIRTSKGLKITPIKDTPHYQWINDIISGADDSISRAAYYNYSKKFFPEEDPSVQLDAVKKMAIAFKEKDDIDKADILTFPPVLKKDSSYCVVLYDGTHRLSIAKALGRKFIKCHIVQETIDIQGFN